MYTIVPLAYEEFKEAYQKSAVAKEAPLLERLASRLKLFPNAIKLWGVRRVSDRAIVAGIAVINSRAHKASYYAHAFYLKEAAKDRPMIALIDHWFLTSLEAGLQVLHFGSCLLAPELGARRGYDISLFKAQFITGYYSYQRPVYRFMRGKFYRTLPKR